MEAVTNKKAKSSRGKEKKELRKLELEKQREIKLLLDVANQQEDILKDFIPFKKYDRNGIEVELEFFPIYKLPAELFEWMFSLLKKNMETTYIESGLGWSDKEKRRECKEDGARYIICFEKGTRNPVAFTHFRFDIEDDREVLYCYEVQLDASVQRKGLGKFLMQLLELLGRKYNMKWIILTTIKINEGATRFYIDRMKYQVDESSPSAVDPLNDYPYEILCKKLAK